MLFQRRRALAVLSLERKATVITLILRQEHMSLLGFPVVRYIDINDAESVLPAINETPRRAADRDHPARARRRRSSRCPSGRATTRIRR